MYLRVLHFKFPNELAKKSVIALTRNITKDQFQNGLLMRLHADISSNSSIAVLLWRNKEDFMETYKVFGSKFIAEIKELGAIITINEGPAEVDKAKRILIALDEAAKAGQGAASLDGRLIDAASAKMAENIVETDKAINAKK